MDVARPPGQDAIDIIAEYERYRDHRIDWAKNVDLDTDFFYGKQWTKDEEVELRRRGQFPLVVNRTYPIVMQGISMLNAKNVEFRVTPRDDGDVKVAKIGNDILAWIQDRNNWQLLYQEVLQDAMVKGVGYVLVYPDLVSHDSPEVGIERIPTEWVFLEPECYRKDLADSEHVFISRMVSKHMFLRMWPGREDIWESTEKEWADIHQRNNMSNVIGLKKPGDIFDPRRKRIRIVEDYTIEKERRVRQVNTVTRGSRYFTLEEWERHKALPAVQEALKLGTYTAKEVWVDIPYRTILAGRRIVKKKAKLPGNYRPLIPFWNIHNDTVYPLGEVRMLRDLNREINKRRSVMISHAQVSTAAPWWVEAGAVDDIEEMERKVARSSSILEYNKGYSKPHRELPAQLPNALYTLEATSKHDIEYTSGIFALSQGDSSNAPETYSATLAIEEFGNRRLNLKQRIFANSLTRVGQVAFQYMQFLYDDDKVIRLVQPDGTEKEYELNLVDRADDKTLKRVMDVSTGTYDIKSVASSPLASNRWAEMREYQELLNIGAIDLEEFWKKTNVFDREGLMERMSKVQQLGSQVEQQQEQLQQYDSALKKSQGDVDQLVKRVVELEYSLQAAKRAEKE